MAPQSLAESVHSLAGRPTARVQILNVKHDGPGCSGSLIFALDEFSFECQGNSGDTFRIGRRDVGQVHKNGIQAFKQGGGHKLGRKYHFTIAGRSRESVEDLFAAWFNLARN